MAQHPQPMDVCTQNVRGERETGTQLTRNGTRNGDAASFNSSCVPVSFARVTRPFHSFVPVSFVSFAPSCVPVSFALAASPFHSRPRFIRPSCVPVSFVIRIEEHATSASLDRASPIEPALRSPAHPLDRGKGIMFNGRFLSMASGSVRARRAIAGSHGARVVLEAGDPLPDLVGTLPAQDGVDQPVELVGELVVGQRILVVAGGKATSETSLVPSSRVTVTRLGMPAG